MTVTRLETGGRLYGIFRMLANGLVPEAAREVPSLRG